MAPIRLGIIGLSSRGWAASSLVPPLLHPTLSDKYIITALCTTSQESAKAASEKYSEQFGHTVTPYFLPDGKDQIANDPNVDMVVVSVRMPTHFEAIVPAIEAGKDIFVEWTPGNGFAETLKIAELIKKKGVRCLVGGQANQSASVKKVKGLLEAGKIGRVLSTSIIFSAGGSEGYFWGPFVSASLSYGAEITNGATPLSIAVGHLLVAVTDILGDLREVTGAGSINYPTAILVDAEGKPTGGTLHNPPHDQVAISGILSGKPYAEGAFINIHCRAGLRSKDKGRTLFRWVIDGEDGTIELVHREQDGVLGCFISMTEKTVLLNGDEVLVEETELDKLGNTAKAWDEFSKGEQGKYTTIDDAMRIHRVLDATLTSIKKGRKVYLI
ncbi:hypothetical protein QCA50_020749 [Cerrena zonata]|uniref:Gfo/Idh/MocA-like oxidoreductase N-terminal domain-containing protein n=1 Tax=Cerrena zonata TaxID=2478898 RepID=A0AAW0FBX8_9APHY